MARLIYSEVALHDLERLADFLATSDAKAASGTIGLIAGAIGMLADHPLVGRPLDDALRELIISRGRTGYVALYSYESAFDTVLILTVRHQREAGHMDE